MIEQRRYERHKLFIPAEAHTDDSAFAVDVIEMSAEGLRLQSIQLLSPDTLVSVTVQSGRCIVFSGWVVWVLDKYVGDGRVYHTGVRIEAITDDEAGIIGDDQRCQLVREIAGLKVQSQATADHP